MAEVLIKSDRLVSISDEIRTMQESSEKMNAVEIVENLKDINSEIDDQTIIIEQITEALTGKLILQKVEQAVPIISIDDDGLITASAIQETGRVEAGTKTATKQLPVQEEKTIIPTTYTQIAVEAGNYTTGDITIDAIPTNYKDTSDATAVASDMLSGKIAYTIDGKITGSMDNLTTSTTIYHATDNASPVIAADAIYRSTCTDNVDRIQLRYNGDGGYIGKNTLIGYETSKFGSATPSQVLSGATFTSTSGINVAGTIPTKTSSDLSASGATVTVPAGYYASQATKSVSTATQVTPSISVNSSGLITASATQTAGFVSAGTKSATKQLTVQAAKTVTPSTSAQTAVASGRYTTGAVTVAAIPSSYIQLNFNVVGGTSQPSNPTENTIWVNTSTSITSSSIIYEKTPTWTASNGVVMILSRTAVSTSGIDFNAVKTGNKNIWIEPIAVYQYENSKWVYKTAQIYTGGQWVPFWNGELYNKGTKNAVYTNSLTKTDGISYTEANTSITVGTGAYSTESITVNNIDFTRFSKLYLNVTSTSFYYANNTANVSASIKVIDSAGGTAVSGDIISNGSGHNGKHTYDVSSLKGNYNIVLSIYTYGAHGCYTNFTFDQLYLEV